MEDRSKVIVSESETEEETVFPLINIGYAAVSPCCDITSASTKVSLQRSSFNEKLVWKVILKIWRTKALLTYT